MLRDIRTPSRADTKHASSRIPAVRGHDDLEWLVLRMRP
jgi:hypothetical protein